LTTRLVLLLVEDEEVVQAFLPHTSGEAFTDGIGSWGMNRRFEDLDRARFRYPSKARPELAIVITNQILRRLPIRGREPSLLRHPRIGRRSSDPDMDHPSRLQFYDEEGKERPKEKVSHLQEVTVPDVRRVRAQKRAPLLTSWLLGANSSHVLLDGALADLKAQLQQFSTNTLSTEDGDSLSPSA
jgi:hypothetical protein